MSKFQTIELLSINSFPIGQVTPTIYELNPTSDIKLSVLAEIKSDSEFLVVLFNGANTDSSSLLPNFSRWSWARQHGFSFISIDDPIVSASEKINLAWYIGNSEFDLQDYLNELITFILSKLNLLSNKVVFYGSSGGGFASLMASIRLRGSTAVVINPQTNIFKYRKTSYKLITDDIFGKSVCELKNEYHRFSVIEAISYFNYFPKTYYKQNTSDSMHLFEHFLPFQDKYVEQMSMLSAYGNNLSVELYTAKGGHNSISDTNQFKSEIINAIANATDEVDDTGDIRKNILKGIIEFENANINWFANDIAGCVNHFIVKGEVVGDIFDITRPQLLLAMETVDGIYEFVIKRGLAYSTNLNCAFKYIKVTEEEREFSISIANIKELGLKRVGLKLWDLKSKIIVDNFKLVLKY